MLYYRKELDGLRALAVIAVIIYHANLSIGGITLFPGGFLGVDIFFVLSGYLITNIIRDGLKNNSLTLKDFYWRRARRIIPVLLAVLFATSIAAYFILLPTDLVEYAYSLKSALCFTSNYFFYHEDSYVAAASIYKPLLHTWSLAVEWQFYLAYPILVWLIVRLRIFPLSYALLSLALVSFAYAQWMVNNNPDFAFYMLPTRAWELILGGMVTFVDRNKINRVITKTGRESILLISVTVIFLSLILLDHNMPHPSYLTLLLIIATCTFIALSDHTGLITRIFCFKPVVFVGVISYSLYLWHQPLFVFFRFLKHDYMLFEQFLGLVAVAMLLAWLSMRFIEKPVRNQGKELVKLFTLIASTGLLFALSTSAISTQGFPDRNGPVIAKLFHNISALQTFRMDGKKCHDRGFAEACYAPGNKELNYILVGDSHAGAIGQSIYDLAQKNNASYLDLSTATCLGLDSVTLNMLNQGVIERSEKCLDNSKQISHYLESDNTPKATIFFVGRLPLYLSGEYFDNQQGGIESGNKFWLESNQDNSVEQAISDKLSLWSAKGHKLVIIYPIPEAGWNVPLRVKQELNKHSSSDSKLNALKNLDLTTSLELYKQRSSQAFSVLNSVQSNDILRIYPDQVLCHQKRCLTHSDSALYYYDDDHLSSTGAKLLVDHIDVKLREQSSN